MLTRFLAALSVGLFVTVLGHYYLYLRLIKPLQLEHNTFWAMLLTSLWALSFFGFALARAVPGFFRRFVELPMFLWMGCAYMLILVCILTSPISLLLQVQNWDQMPLAVGVILSGLSMTGWSVFTVLRPEAIIETKVPVRASLPSDIERLRVAVISDVHVAGLIGRRRMRRLAERVNALNPDMIFVTGDLVDGSVRQLRNEIAPLRKLHALAGIFYVTGNHEYYANPSRWKAFVEKEFGWKVLSNRHETVSFGNSKINIIGVEDRAWISKHRRQIKSDTRHTEAVSKIDPQSARKSLNLLLAHQPKDARILGAHPWIDLQISGHTHGGQMWPLQVFVHSDQVYNRGLYKVGRGTQQLYVNQGTGFWGPPMRLGTQCEISLLSFKRELNDAVES